MATPWWLWIFKIWYNKIAAILSIIITIYGDGWRISSGIYPIINDKSFEKRLRELYDRVCAAVENVNSFKTTAKSFQKIYTQGESKSVPAIAVALIYTAGRRDDEYDWPSCLMIRNVPIIFVISHIVVYGRVWIYLYTDHMSVYVRINTYKFERDAQIFFGFFFYNWARM